MALCKIVFVNALICCAVTTRTRATKAEGMMRYNPKGWNIIKIKLLTSNIFIFETTISPQTVCKQSATENYTM